MNELGRDPEEVFGEETAGRRSTTSELNNGTEDSAPHDKSDKDGTEKTEGLEIQADSLLYGICETEREGKKVFSVKWIMDLDGKKIVCWITDLLSIHIMQKMLDDYVRVARGEEQEEDIDELLPKLTEGVNRILSDLREHEKAGRIYEEAVISLCDEWNFTKGQSHKVLALAVATMKLVEDIYKNQNEKPKTESVPVPEELLSYIR